jgi:uncharacterized membrane protein (DUF485 family)
LTVLLASVLPKHVQEIGAIVGIVSFVFFLALLALYVVRAIELHRLRKTMPFLANPQNGNGQPDEGSSPRKRFRAR